MEPRAKLGADEAKICERIKALRSDRNEKQATIAKDLDMARTSYTKLENGTSRFNIDTIVRLADHFSVDCDFLLRGYVSEQREICQETGLSGKAVENLMLYAHIGFQDLLSQLIEEVDFSAFLAQVSLYITYRCKKNPLLEDWYNEEAQAYREELEKRGFVITAPSEYARNHYENAVEILKKTLDKIVAQREG